MTESENLHYGNDSADPDVFSEFVERQQTELDDQKKRQIYWVNVRYQHLTRLHLYHCNTCIIFFCNSTKNTTPKHFLFIYLV